MSKRGLKRREFLSAAATLAGASAVAPPSAGDSAAGVVSVSHPYPIPSRNASYKATVPDTLDLTERARLGLNGLTGTLDWGEIPEFYFRVTLAPPQMGHDSLSHCACGPKYFEAFPMLRAMTGSDLNADVEARYNQYMLSSLGEDGLFYTRITAKRPWDRTSPEDYANIYGQGRMIRAMLAHYFVDRNPEWMRRLEKLVNKLREIAVYKDDYIYFPTSPGYGDIFSYPKSGWKITELHRGPQQTMADLPDHTMGIPMYLGGTLLPLVRYAEAAGDEKALDLAGKLARFLLKPDSAWIPDGYAKGVTPAEHGQFRGHLHAHTMTLRGILAYGVATNDTGIKAFARDGYEFARTMGIGRLGWFAEYTGKHSHETCGLGNMIALGIQLSEAGVGDYWDDVDGYVRNHLVEGQFTDLASLRSLNSSLSAEQEKMLERSVGTFAGWGTPVALSTVLMNCCMANGSQALYYPWASTVRYSNGSVRVNLPLNRASPWLDVDSYLPYEGKVVLHSKQANRVLVRIPSWVDRHALKCDVDGQACMPPFAGNYLVLDAVRENSSITLTFPIREEPERFVLDDYGHKGSQILRTYTYHFTFRGSTAVKVVSDAPGPNLYDGIKPAAVPTYAAYKDREPFRKPSAPMKTVERHSTEARILSW
ncbi:MAG: hypothetical protein LAP13_22970 [Acidobacteriia bacterium]|nr:hypothetical protein [Terriglobia bacterium]